MILHFSDLQLVEKRILERIARDESDGLTFDYRSNKHVNALLSAGWLLVDLYSKLKLTVAGMDAYKMHMARKSKKHGISREWREKMQAAAELARRARG